MLYKTEAIIIKRNNLNDLDRLLTIYSKDFGKLLLKGKSIRKNQAKLKGHLELFLCSHLMIAPGRGFDIITGAETIESFPHIHNDLKLLSIAHYFSELTDKLIVGQEKDENIWNLLCNSFKELDQGRNSKNIINNFENKLIEFLGYGKQESPINFIQSLINGEIKSYPFLLKFL